MVDLSTAFNEGINNIRTWRNRYSIEDYPQKVVINLFYRKYSMLNMWETIQLFIQRSNMEFLQAVKELEMAYSRSSLIIQPQLIGLLSSQPEKQLGDTSYDAFESNIGKASNGDPAAKEEIEFAYLFHLLSDKSTIYWAAACATGLDKIKAIEYVSGYAIQEIPINDYNTADLIMGRLCSARYLHFHYNPLP